MASDREGPKAIVVLSCDGCRHLEPHGAATNLCKIGGFTLAARRGNSRTPKRCPLHPGKLVAIRREQMFRDIGIPDDPLAWAARRADDEFCADLKADARSLGQEVTDDEATDEKPR